MKLCPRCNKNLPMSSFSLAKKAKDGLQTYCKGCFATRYRETQDHHKALVSAKRGDVERICKECNELKKFGARSRRRVCYSCIYKKSQLPCPACSKPMSNKAERCGNCRSYVGADNPSWKGGVYKHAKGYVQRRVGRKYVFEHILVMQDTIGRTLVRGETVHHKNGVKCDNRIENLELWAKPQPSGVRAADLLNWAREVVALYEPLEGFLLPE